MIAGWNRDLTRCGLSSRAAVVGVWTVVWAAIFAAALFGGAVELAGVSIVAIVVSVWMIMRTQWLFLVAVSAVLGVSIGLVGPLHWVFLPIRAVVAAVPFAIWSVTASRG